MTNSQFIKLILLTGVVSTISFIIIESPYIEGETNLQPEGFEMLQFIGVFALFSLLSYIIIRDIVTLFQYLKEIAFTFFGLATITLIVFSVVILFSQ